MRYKFALLVLYVLALGLPNSEAAKKKPAEATANLKELISNPEYLKKSLGVKALVVPDDTTGKISIVVEKAILDSHLNENIEFFPLPASIKRPIARVRQAPRYPQNLRDKKVEGDAHFLVVIGADGKIKGIYCHQASDEAFAISAAAAIAQWLFVPVKVEKQHVPVLIGVGIKFTLEQILFTFE